jgi:endonuclease I
MKKFSMVLIGLLIVGAIYGQIISLSQTEVNFGQVNIDTESFVDLIVTNETDEELTVDVAENSDVLVVDQSNFVIPANGNYSVHVSVTPETNIVYDNTIFFNVESIEYTVPVKINVGGRFPDSTYNGTYNKWDSELKSALSSIISNNNSISYEDARIELFGYISNENGQVRCVYTNEYYSCSPGGIPNWNSINTEHTWPQSMGATGDAKSDLHHLFPTNSQANSIRGNYPFGIVTNASWQEGGSKKGSNSSGATVFEPRDDHKGDTARALFYFALRYNNPSNFLNSANQQMVLRDWYYDDPVSQYEIHRNEEIKDIQNKPNPFIEYPMLLDRIANITHDVTTPRYPEVFVPLAEYHFPETELNETSTIYIPVTNSGDTSLNISSVTFTNSAYQVGDYPTSLEIGDWGLITVEFTPTEDVDYLASMQINSNANSYSVSLVSGGLVVSNSSDVESLNTLTLSNYPNPFTAKTTLKVHGLKENNISIDIYNIRGQRVNTIKTSSVKGGNGSVTWNGRDLNGENLSSGLYFVKIQSAGQSVTKKILMMK